MKKEGSEKIADRVEAAIRDQIVLLAKSPMRPGNCYSPSTTHSGSPPSEW